MRLEVLNPLFAPIQSFRGIGPKLAKWMQHLCGPRALDVLFHQPSGLNQRPILSTRPTQPTLGTIQITVTSHNAPHSRKQPYRINADSRFGEVQLVFFHAHASYLNKKLPIGATVWISGRLQPERDLIQVLHPDYIEPDAEHIPQYETIYPLQAGIRGKVIRSLINQILPTLSDLPEEIDPILIQQQHWPSWREAIYQIHHPKTLEDCTYDSPARMRLAFDELLANQVALQLIRQHNKRQAGIALPAQNKLRLRLPFTLTTAQERCLTEIKTDLASSERMIRLLQGDVGSGKTVVALLAALQAIENKRQVAFLAPTDILVRQHFEKIKKLCAPLGISIQLLTAQEKGKKRQQILTDLSAGKIDFLIGTHAILENTVTFHQLALIIIDEQHRFGVKQRLALAKKEQSANVLVMSATPIPRTLALTTYGDMDISILNEKPMGRQHIETRALPLSNTAALIQRLQQLDTQIYWVCPLVKESEKSDLMAAQKRYECLVKTFGPQVGLIHGQMKAEEKEKQMQLFLKGQIKILVSTTVIEVGVDVPAAGLMIIEHAERFGLATLHQLRGRVGRGQNKAACILLHGKLSNMAYKRLAVLRESEDGFFIAEADLKLRGSGEVLGTQQSGLPVFHFAQLPEHADLLQLAHQHAQNFLTKDPMLQSKSGQALKNMLYLFGKEEQIHLLKAG